LAQKVNSQQDGGNNKMNVESNKGGQEEDEEAKMMREMASMSAWNDDEGGDWGDSADAEPAEQKIATSSKDEGSSKSSKKKGGDPNSRILKKNMNVARLDKIIWNCILKSYAVLTLCVCLFAGAIWRYIWIDWPRRKPPRTNTNNPCPCC
jgi:hypothetical protein